MVFSPSSNYRGKEMKGREGTGGEGDVRHARKFVVMPATGIIATYAILE
jgi:hypothetical protein